MAILQGINNYTNNFVQNRSLGQSQKLHDRSGALNNRNNANLTVTTESIKRDSFSFEFASKDGDKVLFSMESLEYQKTKLSLNANDLSDEDMKNLVKEIKEEFHELKKAIIEKFVEAMTGKETGSNKTEDVAESEIELEIPEYWNAENTSERIVQFAISFFGSFEGASEEFLAKIKGAIEDGFNQAKEILGSMPDAVGKLTNETYDLVMKKLDEWAQSVNANSEQDEPVEANVPKNKKIDDIKVAAFDLAA